MSRSCLQTLLIFFLSLAFEPVDLDPTHVTSAHLPTSQDNCQGSCGDRRPEGCQCRPECFVYDNCCPRMKETCLSVWRRAQEKLTPKLLASNSSRREDIGREVVMPCPEHKSSIHVPDFPIYDQYTGILFHNYDSFKCYQTPSSRPVPWRIGVNGCLDFELKNTSQLTKFLTEQKYTFIPPEGKNQGSLLSMSNTSDFNIIVAFVLEPTLTTRFFPSYTTNLRCEVWEDGSCQIIKKLTNLQDDENTPPYVTNMELKMSQPEPNLSLGEIDRLNQYVMCARPKWVRGLVHVSSVLETNWFSLSYQVLIGPHRDELSTARTLSNIAFSYILHHGGRYRASEFGIAVEIEHEKFNRTGLVVGRFNDGWEDDESLISQTWAEGDGSDAPAVGLGLGTPMTISGISKPSHSAAFNSDQQITSTHVSENKKTQSSIENSDGTEPPSPLAASNSKALVSPFNAFSGVPLIVNTPTTSTNTDPTYTTTEYRSTFSWSSSSESLSTISPPNTPDPLLCPESLILGNPFSTTSTRPSSNQRETLPDRSACFMVWSVDEKKGSCCDSMVLTPTSKLGVKKNCLRKPVDKDYPPRTDGSGQGDLSGKAVRSSVLDLSFLLWCSLLRMI